MPLKRSRLEMTKGIKTNASTLFKIERFETHFDRWKKTSNRVYSWRLISKEFNFLRLNTDFDIFFFFSIESSDKIFYNQFRLLKQNDHVRRAYFMTFRSEKTTFWRTRVENNNMNAVFSVRRVRERQIVISRRSVLRHEQHELRIPTAIGQRA